MFNQVNILCGKQAHNLGQVVRKSCVALSTLSQYAHSPVYLRGAKAAFIPKPFRAFHPHPSPANIAVSPLVEHYFYPVSTPTTISPIRLKI
jgi:hypothetical protein